MKRTHSLAVQVTMRRSVGIDGRAASRSRDESEHLGHTPHLVTGELAPKSIPLACVKIQIPEVPQRKMNQLPTSLMARANLFSNSLQNVPPFKVWTLIQETQLCESI